MRVPLFPQKLPVHSDKVIDIVLGIEIFPVGVKYRKIDVVVIVIIIVCSLVLYIARP